MAKPTTKRLDEGQLEMMWNYQKADVAALKELCDRLRQAMIQKTGGQRKDDPAEYIPWEDIGTIVSSIVNETMALYLSEGLDRLECEENE